MFVMVDLYCARATIDYRYINVFDDGTFLIDEKKTVNLGLKSEPLQSDASPSTPGRRIGSEGIATRSHKVSYMVPINHQKMV